MVSICNRDQMDIGPLGNPTTTNFGFFEFWGIIEIRKTFSDIERCFSRILIESVLNNVAYKLPDMAINTFIINYKLM